MRLMRTRYAVYLSAFLGLIVAGAIIARADRDRATHRIDLTQRAQIAPGQAERLFYVQMDRHGKHLKAGDVWLFVQKSPGNILFPRCRLTLSVPSKASGVPIQGQDGTKRYEPASVVIRAMTPIVTYEAVCNQDGFAFWGIPGQCHMVNAPTVSRFARIGLVKTRGVTWIDAQGHSRQDLCEYGLIERPHGLYTIMFRFAHAGEIGFILSPRYCTPVGLHLIGEPWLLKGTD